MTAAREILNATAIYDGQRYLGEVVERRCGAWEAADAAGKVIGSYADARAAADAILRQAGT